MDPSLSFGTASGTKLTFLHVHLSCDHSEVCRLKLHLLLHHSCFLLMVILNQSRDHYQ